MTHKRIWPACLLILALVLGLAACGGEAPAPSPLPPATATSAPLPPTVEPTVLPTMPPTAEPTALPPADATSAPSAGGDLDLGSVGTVELASFRSSLTLTVEGTSDGTAVDRTIEVLIEHTTDPAAEHVVIRGLGVPGGLEGDSTELYLVDDVVYLKLAGEWLTLPASEEAGMLTEGLIEPESFLEDTCGWQRQADTDVDGVAAQHWTLSKADLDRCVPESEQVEMGELTDAGGDLYLALDGGYIVRLDLFFEGKNLNFELEAGDEPLTEGRLDLSFTTSDVNQPFTIEVPENLPEAGAFPDDIPLPPDAHDVSNAFGLTTFLSPGAPADVAAFFQAEMPNNGWTDESGEPLGDTYMLTFTKDNRTVNLMISADADSGETAVLLTETASE